MTLRRVVDLGPRIARVTVFLLVVAIGLQFLLGRLVRNKVDGTLLELGAGLVQLGTGAADPDAPRVIELNGTQLHFDMTTRAEAVDAVLDAAQASCQSGPDPSGLSGKSMRGGDGQRGFVACFTRLGPVGSVGPVGAVIGEVAMPAPSGYRYVYAQPGDERTQVVSIWAEGDLDLERLFPPDADAPGRDAPGVPRPPDSRRILSARELGAPQQITLYQSRDRSPEQLDAWYRARLPRLGWRPLDGARKPAGEDKVLVVDRSGSLAALVFSQEGDGGRAVAILTSL